jgi:hypothetical protein
MLFQWHGTSKCRFSDIKAEFIIFVKQTKNIYKKYLFLKALLLVSMFIIILRESVIMYAKVTKLIK